MRSCLICFAPCSQGMTLAEYVFVEDVICGTCRKKMISLRRQFQHGGLSIYAFYMYDDFLENLLFQFKEGRDIALCTIFFHRIKKEMFDKFRGYTLVYMPSSTKKNKERTFFALKEMLKEVPLPKVELFEKKKDYKQSLQKREDRTKIEKVLFLRKNSVLPDTPLLLVDDVCTSGSTLLRAYHLLSHHRYDVKACVLCAHPHFVEMCDGFLFKR